jgi:release factor glutamine methyltransferase
VTLREHLAAARARLAAAGVPAGEAALDADLLARHILQWDRASLIAHAADPAPGTFAAAYQAVVDRRARREPVALIRERQEFWGRDFTVTGAVLIPRPETELVVEAALDWMAGRAVRIADIGTGSGCLAVTLALERPSSSVTATDVSADALAVARTNAARLNARVDFRIGPLLADAVGPFDLIVSNPPYVAERDRASLPPEVRDFEPAVALFAGEDGLDVIRRLVPAAAAHLSPRGRLLMEIGHDQAAEVAALIKRTPGLSLVRWRRDLQGIPRVAVIGKR